MDELRRERLEIESMLGRNEKDSAILRTLNDRRHGPAGWIEDGFSPGGSKFRPSGKLRREVGVEDAAKRILIGIGESPQKDLFERYRLVRMQLLAIPGGAETPADAAGTAQAPADSSAPASPPPLDSLALAPGAGVAPAPADTGAAALDSLAGADSAWTGSYRANGGAREPGPGSFAGLDECQAWAERKADEYRKGAFAFEFECNRDGRSFKRKVW